MTNRDIYKFLFIAVVALAGIRSKVQAQGMHFSQYYNAPMLLNPANTALMSESDYRLGVNYRNQWAQIPVPYKTISGYGDFQLFRNQNLTNWMGMGFAAFNDKAGDGQLSLSKYEAFLAYHVETGDYTMFSAGLSCGYVQRTVDFNKLSFDQQWDGFKFDPNIANGETQDVAQTSYVDVGAGINFAFFPNEFTYIKLGAGVGHVNLPKETFYGQDTRLKFRPTLNFDALFITSPGVTLNPSIYYTRQGTAQELVYGMQGTVTVGEENYKSSSFIFGIYHRWQEAVVGVLGFQWSGLKLTTSYDFTLSSLTPDTRSNGAMEMSLVFQGFYGGGARENMNCPRF